MAVRIVCINKSGGYHDNPYEAVSYYGWVDEATGENNKADRISMVNWVKKGGVAYVKDNVNKVAYCYVNRSTSGNEFLQTKTDGRMTDNLLYLPECI